MMSSLTYHSPSQLLPDVIVLLRYSMFYFQTDQLFRLESESMATQTELKSRIEEQTSAVEKKDNELNSTKEKLNKVSLLIF